MKQLAVRRAIARALTTLAVLLAACGDGPTGGGGGGPNPQPVLTSASPNPVVTGTPGVVLTLGGSSFLRGSVVRLDGSDRPTQFVSGTELRTTLTAADLASERLAMVTVVNPAPGGGSSVPYPLIVQLPPFPVPTLSHFEPAFVMAGSSGATVTLVGTGFVPQTRVVRVSGPSPSQVTYVSPTQLQLTFGALEVALAATLQLLVVNPSPGGGESNGAAFEIRSPVPVIASLQPAQITAGEAGYVLRVNGTGLFPNSEVRFAGAARPTRLVAGQLEATLGEDDLRAPGSFPVTIVNPAPGGGASAAAQLQVVAGTPRITELPSQAAAAGRPGFTLMLHGSSFVDGAVVRWNGTPLPTRYLSGIRLTADVPAQAVAAAGTVQLTVVNPAPGGESAPATLRVRDVPATTITSNRVLSLPARDLVYSAHTGRLYASIPGSAAEHANRVVAIDPATGAVTGSVEVGSEPAALAISHDGRVLWVGLDGARAVRRVEAATLTPGVQFSLDGGVAEELEVMPGEPGTVAVVVSSGLSLREVAVYDHGARRPGVLAPNDGSNSIEFGADGSVLYGYRNESSDFGFRTMRVTAAGLQVIRQNHYLVRTFWTRIYHAAGRVYAGTGEAVDAQRSVRVGVMGGGVTDTRIAAAISPALGRAFYVDVAGRIYVYDLNTFGTLGSLLLGSFTPEEAPRRRTRLVQWGADGLAVASGGKIHIVRTPIAGG